MKTIEFSSTPLELNQLFDAARTEEVLVRLGDGSEFLLIAVDEFDDEIAKSRGNSRLMSLLEARALDQSAIPLDEVKRHLNSPIRP